MPVTQCTVGTKWTQPCRGLSAIARSTTHSLVINRPSDFEAGGLPRMLDGDSKRPLRFLATRALSRSGHCLGETVTDIYNVVGFESQPTETPKGTRNSYSLLLKRFAARETESIVTKRVAFPELVGRLSDQGLVRAVLVVPIDDESQFVLEIRLVLGHCQNV